MTRFRRILGPHEKESCPNSKNCPPSLHPPSLPPPPPHPSHILPPTSFPSGNDSRLRLTNVFIIASSIFAASVLMFLVYYAILRRRRRPIGRATVGATINDDDENESIDDLQPFHHIWYIRTVGLDASTIDSIAVAEYRAGDGLLDGASDCSVCLGEFCDGERVRLLPKCGHAFHVPCIDTWLRAHINCPLCRAHIVDPDPEPTPPTADAAALPITAASESVDLGAPSSDSVEIPQIASQPLEEETGEITVPEIRTQIGIPVNPSQVFDSLPESSLPREESGLQPVQRSISLDTSLVNSIILRLKPEEEDIIYEEGKDLNFEEEDPRKNRGKPDNSHQKGHSDIGPSLSSSGRGFFSRHGRIPRIHSMPL
ncbi:hypothetical protein Cni_G09154 [Canna indica]|uniref:RING-type E3 ubiquitin transferase n=1 Tax=Canna indica TaxID=4628 RepID=A0AAQ3Q696_9LILI|nr:hypothetical protein Cni_G09154 [Canna indica]